jgi:hypothetical protein
MGCRDDKKGNNADAGPNGGDGGGGGEVSIQEVQSPNMPAGTGVTLRGVVVVAVDAYGGRVGGVYVMEPEGGPNSGVLLFADVTQASGVAVGDLIDVTNGVKDEFTLETNTCMRASDCTLTEIKAADGATLTLTKVGDGTVPAPQVLNPWDLAADDAEAEKWESVLIRFDNVSVNTAPYSVSSTDTTLKEMRLTGPFLANSDLTDLGTPTSGDCLASITGMGNYFFNYKILPRTSADIATGGSGCPQQEATIADCTDNMDNDYDGFKDCEDRSCQEAVPDTCTTDTTIVAIQDGTVAKNTLVRLTNVVVIGIDFNKEHLWVADSATGAVYNGVYVYRGSSASALPSNITIGATVDVTGTVDEFDYQNSCGATLTEISDATVTFKTGGTSTTPLTGVDVATLIGSNAEQYEGVLVTLPNVRVVDAADPGNNVHEWSVGVTGTKLWVEDDIYRYAATANECVTITGIMHYNAYSDCRPVILPRDGEVVAGTCN